MLVLESGDGDPSYLLHSLAGWLGFTMVGLMVGRVSTLRKQIRTELEDRRQAQQALQESEERYRSLFENSQTGMLLAEALRETAALLNSSLDLDAVLDAILHNVGKVLPHDAVNIMRVEDGVARILRAEGYPEGEKYEAIMNLRMVVADVPNLRLMAETQQPLIIPDVSVFPGWLDFPETRWLRSYAGAPVLIDGQIAGYVNLDSATPGFFHSTHTSRLQAFANQAAVAIRNARLYEQAQEQARQMSLLNEITRTAISARDVSQMLDSVVERIYELFNANSAFITLWDEDLQAPISAAASGHLKDVYLSLPPTPQKPSLTSVVLQARRPIAVDDVCCSPYIDPDLPVIFQNRSMLGIPLLVNERKLGAILISYDQVHHCTPEEIALGEQVAGPIALALAQAQLLERERLRTAELARANNLISALSRVAARIETRPEPGEVMKTLVSELKLLGLRCLLATTSPGDAALTVRYSSALLEPDSLSPNAVHLLTSHRLLPNNFAIYEELIDRHQVVFLTDPEPLLRHAMKDMPEEVVDEILNHALITATTGVAVLPLIVEDQALGMLALWGESMHQEDIPAATLFASQVAIALQNAHLYTEVQQLAVTDELTGLYNRRGLYSLGRREAERALRFPTPAFSLDAGHR